MAEKPLFPGQLDDERIIVYERRHWFTIINWIGGRSLLLLPLSLVIAWGVTTILELPSGIRLICWLVIPLPALAWIGWKALDWGNDRYIVTDKRVIHIEKEYLTREKRDEAPLAMIQDVLIKVDGIMTHLLYFGDVVIQTAGTLGTIRFRGIPKPREAQARILALVSQAKAAAPAEEEPQAIQAVREMVGLPQPEPKPPPRAAEGLQQESETPKRAQISEVIKMMVFTKQVFGENQIIWHKHRWVLFQEMISPVLVFVILLIVWSAISLLFGLSLWFDLLLVISLAANSVWVIWRGIDWRNDLYIITDDRVIDIEKVPFRYEHRREASLDKIQDVRYLQEGFIALRLDFGNVRLETAGGIEAFTFDSVPHPKQVQAEIFKRIAQFRQETGQQERKTRQAEFLDLLGRYHQGLQGNGEPEP